MRNVQMFKEVVGNAAARNVAIVTTKWGLVEPELGEKREAELKDDPLFFQPLLGLQASMVRYPIHDDHNLGLEIVKRMIESNRPIELQIQVEMVEKELQVGQTTAGLTLSRALAQGLREAEEKHKKQMREMEEAQMRQHGIQMQELQDQAEAAYQERAAEFERRRVVMEANVYDQRHDGVLKHIMDTVKGLLGIVNSGMRLLVQVGAADHAMRHVRREYEGRA